jgi:ABC-type multidrug transport system fused ATPase/permease subunit
MYTLYVGSGLQMLTYAHPSFPVTPCPHLRTLQSFLRKPLFRFVLAYVTGASQASIMRGIGAGTRIFELLDRAPAVQPGVGVVLDPARSGPLRFENITFSYPTRRGVNVLEDFHLEVNVGENVAIVYVLHWL